MNAFLFLQCFNFFFRFGDAYAYRVYCPTGKYMMNNACWLCEPGEYQDQPDNRGGPWTCKNCPAGKYNGNFGGSCTECPTGKYNDNTGQQQCKKCDEGKYNSETGQIGA